MRADDSKAEGRIESIWHPGDQVRAEAKAAYQEGSRRGFLARTAAAAGAFIGVGTLAQADDRIVIGKRRAAAAKAAGGESAESSGEVVAAAASPTKLANLYPGWNKTNFGQIQTDENAHVAFLVNALGAAARPELSLQNLAQPNQRQFAVVSFELENTGVAAYLAAAPVISNPAYLAAAASILTIEARHAGYLGTLFNGTTDLFNHSFDAPTSIDQVITNAGGFITSLNGGPALTFSTTPSAENDVAILNFALALEYLEQAYYNLNVPALF